MVIIFLGNPVPSLCVDFVERELLLLVCSEVLVGLYKVATMVLVGIYARTLCHWL